MIRRGKRLEGDAEKARQKLMRARRDLEKSRTLLEGLPRVWRVDPACRDELATVVDLAQLVIDDLRDALASHP